MRIGIDIDDTITNTFETGIKYAEQFTKEYCNRTYTDIDKRLGNIKSHKHWKEIFEWGKEEEEAFFKNYYEKILREVNLKEEVCDVINKLYSTNDLIFITARYETQEKNVENLTRDWLNRNHIPFNQLYLGRKKSEVCEENHIDIFIDDSYDNCKSVQSSNTKVYLIDHITNKNIKDKEIERVYGWKDLYERIVKFEEER